MPSLKETLKRIPGLHLGYRYMVKKYLYERQKRRSAEEVFADIYRQGGWGAKHSVSGPGSELTQTEIIRKRLPVLCRSLGVQSILDIPCGDFYWMKHVDLNGVEYLGADIVADLIRANSQYESSNIRFTRMNLIEDDLPRVDLVFCRDCIQHLSFKDAFTALQNIARSGSRYLLTTTFPSQVNNPDILNGEWRPLNLQIPPFSFPAPIEVINEECTEWAGAYSDKSLALWRTEDIGDCLKHTRAGKQFHFQ